MVQALTSPRRVVLPLFVLALLAGCGGAAVRDVYFSLRPEPVVVPSGAPIPGTLRISPLAARGFIGGSRIVYRTADEPLEVQRYNELLWEEVPARAIADELLAAMRAARAFDSVVTAGDPARATYLLSGEVTRFEHRPTDQPPGVSAELTLALVAARSRELLVSKTYAGFEPTGNAAGEPVTPQAMAAAFNRLTGRLVGEVVGDVQRLGPKLR
jgi:cholesterol transport system auxiliary component